MHAFSSVHNDNYPAKGYAGKSPAGLPYKDAVITEQISDKRCIDGIDQTSFLVADKGQSKRDAAFMYSENNFMAVRWMEYKYKVHLRVFEIHAPRRNLDESTVSEAGLSPRVYNLYMDSKEQKSIGRRMRSTSSFAMLRSPAALLILAPKTACHKPLTL